MFRLVQGAAGDCLQPRCWACCGRNASPYAPAQGWTLVNSPAHVCFDPGPGVPAVHAVQEMYDFLAQRQPEEEAFCAVCGDGHSGGWLIRPRGARWAYLVGKGLPALDASIDISLPQTFVGSTAACVLLRRKRQLLRPLQVCFTSMFHSLRRGA